ncbi:response regulator transcription factor [Streptomyces zhihengii]|uniref:Response regulator transcription factor n=1 Tax=Streptomyces zhihengii TaxID=1818004 RepID=A0ABS2V3W6_9ACTN|nr:response regulator transcription factor [Streptomyces zhihengii]MBM9624514.1 response regulator transcription factor [Streptomyces zhihengii]
MKTGAVESSSLSTAGQTETQRQIAVKIHASDVIAHAGLVHSLQQSPRLREFDQHRDTEPDVFTLSVKSVDASTLKLIDTLSPSGSGRFVLVIDKDCHVDVYAAIERGVRAMLWRSNFSTTAICNTISAVADGEGCLPAGLQGALMRQVQLVHREVLAPRGLTSSAFSQREIEVLRLLSEGLDLEQVSQRMQYSERTIKNVLYAAMKRHHFTNRTQAVSHAIRSGLI